MPVEEEESTLLVGRYRLERPIGRGGMAEVWAGWDERLDRPVAIKLLRADLAARPDVVDRLRREARAAAALDHPAIVRVLDADEADGLPFLVMERLPGASLADRYLEGRVDEAWLATVAAEVASGLAEAHRAGVIHRDIKPGNILLTADGQARLADFGIATSLALDGDPTSTGLVLGTPAYLAPERIEGAPATPAADVWGLAVVLYEGFTGVRPFQGANPAAVARSVLTEEPIPLGRCRPDLPAHLTRAVERGMAKDPAARFADGAGLASALATPPGGGVVAAPVPDGADETVALDVHDTQVMPVVIGAGHDDLGPSPGAASGGDPAAPAIPVPRATLGWVSAGVALLVVVAVALTLARFRSGSDVPPPKSPAPAVVTTVAPTTVQVTAEDNEEHPRPGKAKGGKHKDED